MNPTLMILALLPVNLDLDLDRDGSVHWRRWPVSASQPASAPAGFGAGLPQTDLLLFVDSLLRPRNELGVPRGESPQAELQQDRRLYERCDVNGDGAVDGEDIQGAVNDDNSVR